MAKRQPPRIMTEVTNNFNNEVFFTSSTGQDLKDEIRHEARQKGKKISDYTAKPYKP